MNNIQQKGGYTHFFSVTTSYIRNKNKKIYEINCKYNIKKKPVIWKGGEAFFDKKGKKERDSILSYISPSLLSHKSPIYHRKVMATNMIEIFAVGAADLLTSKEREGER